MSTESEGRVKVVAICSYELCLLPIWSNESIRRVGGGSFPYVGRNETGQECQLLEAVEGKAFHASCWTKHYEMATHPSRAVCITRKEVILESTEAHRPLAQLAAAR